MKHLKLFEGLSLQSIKNTVNDYNDMINIFLPAIKEKYDELAKNDYEPEYGDQPYILDNEQLVLQGVSIINGGFEFCLQTFDNNGQIRGIFYIELSNKDVDKILIKIDANKYNL